MNYTIPAVLFSGLSMFFNGYTIRYNNLVKLIREFNRLNHKDENISSQIKHLRKRLLYIKWIQLFSVISLLLSTFSIMAQFFNLKSIAEVSFTMSMIIFLLSLIVSGKDLFFSTTALNNHLTKGGL